MRYFTAALLERIQDDEEGVDDVWERAIQDYESHLSKERHQWSQTIQCFIESYPDLHDRNINSVSVSLDRSHICIEVSLGTIYAEGVEYFKCDLDMDALPEAGIVWLYEELVSPSQLAYRNAGLVEFNVLTESGELSIVAKDMRYQPR